MNKPHSDFQSTESNWPDPIQYVRGSGGNGETGYTNEILTAFGDPLAEGQRHHSRTGMIQVSVCLPAGKSLPDELIISLESCDLPVEKINLRELHFMPGGKQILCNTFTAWVVEQCLPKSWLIYGSIAMLGLPKVGDCDFTDEPQLIVGGIGPFRPEPSESVEFSGPILSCSFMDKLYPVRPILDVNISHGWTYQIAPRPSFASGSESSEQWEQ